MMKRNILAVVIPALLVAGAANAAEIYNKNGNKLDFYGKMVGEHVWTTNGDTSSDDTTYARIGLKGETQINDQLIGYGQWEYNMDASNVEGSQTTKTVLRGILGKWKLTDRVLVNWLSPNTPPPSPCCRRASY